MPGERLYSYADRVFETLSTIGVPESKLAECMTWAFGWSWECLEIKGSNVIWNKRHGKEYGEIAGTDTLLDSFEKIGQAYLKEKKIMKDENMKFPDVPLCGQTDNQRTGTEAPRDYWAHRGQGMRCKTCMYFVEKWAGRPSSWDMVFGRCRRHAPTMSGWPVARGGDWCGDHKIDENKG